MTEIRVSYSVDFINKVASYLAARPYAEVYSLMAELQTTGVRVEEKLEVNPAMQMMESRQ